MDARSRPFEWDAAAYGALPLPHVGWGRGIVDRLRLAGHERVLELGCGTGRDAAELLDRWPGCSFVGLDASWAMLEQAAGALAPFRDRVELSRVDLREPFRTDAPVDAAMSVATLHWVPDHAPAFGSVAAALRPGGRFVAECGGRGNIASLQAAIAAVFDDDCGWDFAGVHDTATLLTEAGFGEVSVRLRPDPLVLAPDRLRPYLATVILGRHLDGRPEAERRALVDAVAARLDAPVIDYVRLEFEAVRL